MYFQTCFTIVGGAVYDISTKGALIDERKASAMVLDGIHRAVVIVPGKPVNPEMNNELNMHKNGAGLYQRIYFRY